MFVAVLSDKPELRENFCKSMGKELSKDDIALYSVERNGQKIWLIDPVHYPEKIQPLLHSLSMADLVVFLVDGVSPKVGELLVAVNSMKLDKGIIMSNVTLPITGTVLEKYEKVTDLAAAKEKMLQMQVSSFGDNILGLIHSVSNVPSIGHVAIGTLKGGRIKKHDSLFILPACSDFEARSIYVDGSEVEELSAGSKFEIAYKGDHTGTGILVPLRHGFQVEKIINGRFVKSPFFKDELNGKIRAYSNLQYVEGHVTDNDLNLSEPLAFEKGESILIIDASNQKLRIAGVFQSKW